MENGSDNPTKYSPHFLSDEEAAAPSDVGYPSMDEAAQFRDVKLEPGSYLSYDAPVAKLRLPAPHLYELNERLGKNCHVLQFKVPFSLDSVPNEWKRKDSPFLWKVEIPNQFRGFVSDSDRGTFYFESSEQVPRFIGKMNGEGSASPSFGELLAQRDRLRKLLG